MIRTAALSLALLATLAGCTNATSAAQPTTTESDFVTMMQGLLPMSTTDSDITLGHSVCAALDTGSTPGAVMSIMASAANPSANVKTPTLEAIMRISVSTYCPKHEDIVPAT